jgi:hypothetical protein
LESLRDDITILTYNYDPYLGFLLLRALEHRWRITRKGQGLFLDQNGIKRHRDFEILLNAVTSGFGDPSSLAWLDEDKIKPSFCLLQLHGSICNRDDDVCGFNSLFGDAPLARANRLFSYSPGCADQIPPPLLFPWEILDGNDFIPRASFPYQPSAPLYDLFIGIWKRARREVQSAKKISFVGLSMHDFLSDGLRFLFKDKKEVVKVAVANPDNVIPGSEDHTHLWASLPHTSAFSVNLVLQKIAPDILRRSAGQVVSDFTVVKDFGEFVKTQMRPCGLKV